MQIFFLFLTVIISRAVPSPIAQLNPDSSYDIAFSGFDDAGITSPEPFQLAQSETQNSEAPAQAPPEIPQPGDPTLKQAPQPKPEVQGSQQVPKPFKQPFSCEAGKSGTCCVGGTRDGMTSGCINYLPWEDWCQNQESFKCCKAQPEKDSAIAAGTLPEDYFREDCEDPKQVEWTTQQKFQNFGNSLLRVIIPSVNTGLPIPKPVWIPGQ